MLICWYLFNLFLPLKNRTRKHFHFFHTGSSLSNYSHYVNCIKTIFCFEIHLKSYNQGSSLNTGQNSSQLSPNTVSVQADAVPIQTNTAQNSSNTPQNSPNTGQHGFYLKKNTLKNRIDFDTREALYFFKNISFFIPLSLRLFA